MFKKGKKEHAIWKFGQTCTKFENILKGRWLCAIIARNKLLEEALICTQKQEFIYSNGNNQDETLFSH